MRPNLFSNRISICIFLRFKKAFFKFENIKLFTRWLSQLRIHIPYFFSILFLDVVFIPFWWLGFWLFFAMKLQNYYLIVCLFFICSRPSCLANRKHYRENHATKVTKKPKTKLPRYVMSWTKESFWLVKKLWDDFFNNLYLMKTEMMFYKVFDPVVNCYILHTYIVH